MNIEKKVMIVVPTINHSEIIEEWLNIYEKNSLNHRFEVLIIDSSDDDKTKKVCEQHPSYVKWEKYENYEKEDSLKQMDNKALYSFFATKAEYVWLTSDARIPNVDGCYDILDRELTDDVDLLHFFYTGSKMNADYIIKHPERKKVNMISNVEVVEYKQNDLKNLFLDFFWSISTYGISIVKRNLIVEQDTEYVKKTYSGLSFLYPAMIFEFLNNKNHVKCKVINHGCFIANKLRKVNTWKASGDAIKVYSEHVVKIIEALPTNYNDNKERVISEFALNNSHMTCQDIIEWRKLGYYNIKEFCKYKKYIRRVAEKGNLFMFIVAIMPINNSKKTTR